MRPILRGGSAENRCVVVLQLLAVDGCALGEALTHKKLTAKGEEVTLPPCSCTFKKKKMFPFADCDFSSVLSAFTDGQCAQFRAGGVIPWHPGQGHVQSDVHVVGGEDQPVPGPQGEASDQMWQKKTKLKSQGEFGHTLFVSVTQDELHRSTKSSMVIGLLDIYGFEVLQHNRYQWQLLAGCKAAW